MIIEDLEELKKISEELQEMLKTGIRKCFNCGSDENITRHHLMGNGEGRVIPLCKKCHDKIDNIPYAKGVNFGYYQGKVSAVNRISRNLHNDGNGKLFIGVKSWNRVKESLKLFPSEIIEKAEKPEGNPAEETEKRWFKKYMFD